MNTEQPHPAASHSFPAQELLAAARFGTPDPPSAQVSRPRLLEVLAGAERVPLVLVSAPAGSGKTSLVAEWVQGSRDEAGPVGWITFESGDTAFWAYLLECLARLGLDVDGVAPPARADAPLGRERLMTLAAEIAGSPRRWTVVVDGYEMVSLTTAREVDFLLRHSFGNLQLVFVGRVDPVLPLYRYRLDDALVEVRGTDLAFTDEEASQLLRGLGVALSSESVHDLNARVKGWVAGLRFAARALVDQEDPEQSAATVVAQTGNINEYLIGEVLEAQAPEVRQFLLDTCVTDQLWPGLTEELAGPAAARLLAELVRANAFIEPVSEDPGSYRYYPFFRELLRVQLAYEQPAHMAELHRRAAAWFRRQGLLGKAVAHLAAIPAWDEVATEILDPPLFGRLLVDGLSGPLYDVASRLPVDLDGRAACLVRAAAALVGGDRAGCAEELAAARSAPADEARDGVHGVAAAVLDALRGCLAEDADTAAALVSEAERAIGAPHLAAPPRSEVEALVQLSAGVTMIRRGDLASARELLRNAAGLGGDEGCPGFRADCLGYLALVDALEGHLARATRTAGDSLAAAADAGMPLIERSPAARVALARVALEQYDLDAARDHVPAATASRRLEEDSLSRAVAASVVAGLERAAGKVQPALERLEGAASELDATDPWLADYLRVEAARVGLADGQADVALQELESVSRYDGREAAVVAAAAYASQGMDAAVKRSLADARGSGLPIQVEVSKLLVEVAQETRRRSPGRARVLLARSLRLAAPEELRRPFREAGPGVQRVLSSDPRLLREHEWLSRPGPRVPAQRRGGGDGREPAAADVVERLTAKELEVLGHLEELLTTEEIAQKMFVSVNTVRTHVRSILRKLGVNRRNAAVRKARDLGMLAD